MSTLSTHVLDTALGKPAQGIPVSLEHEGAIVSSGMTDADGRVRELLPKGAPLSPGSYRLTFAVAEYLARAGHPSFYDKIVVQFTVGAGQERFHVPLLLSPFGYTTYRGS
ncbi:MAG TPA: hydroxyisourate hydrolase [Gemmatimonadales bacterium]|jgi:5-hydroxyisourate hydrolase|nr:hydroxyisourate hydrolase [Gemmatimonadales bacterium]